MINMTSVDKCYQRSLSHGKTAASLRYCRWQCRYFSTLGGTEMDEDVNNVRAAIRSWLLVKIYY